MGGYGSGYQGARRTAVEDGITLSIFDLVRKRALVPGAWTSGEWIWRRGIDPEPIGRIGYTADACDPESATLRLTYAVNGEPMDYRVRLETTRPNYGGRRWWFRCPLLRRDGRAGPRVAKLHLPPGRRYFGSREVYGLTYTSCRESGKWNSLYARVAANLGTDAASVRRALNDKRKW